MIKQHFLKLKEVFLKTIIEISDSFNGEETIPEKPIRVNFYYFTLNGYFKIVYAELILEELSRFLEKWKKYFSEPFPLTLNDSL